MTDRQLTVGDEVEVKLEPYSGGRVRWVKARVEALPDEYGQLLVELAGGVQYHGSTRKYAKAGDWR